MTTAKKTAPAAKKTTASRSSSTEDKTTTQTTTPASDTPTPATTSDQGEAQTTTPATTSDTTQSAPLDPADSQDGAQADGAGAVSNDPAGQTRQDFGPGTGNVAPKETGSRPPATIVNGDPNAAPLDPPADHSLQTEPPLGYQTSTTDQAYAEAAGRTIAGENHLRLLDDDGNELSADDLFVDDDPNKTYVVTARRITEEFTYPNTRRRAWRLMYVAGAKVPRFQAERIKAAVGQAADDGPVPSADSQGAGTLKPTA